MDLGMMRLKAMWTGEEKERTRIARELHDGISSMLSAFNLEFTEMGKNEPDLSTTPRYVFLTDMLKQIRDEVRASSHNFMPEIILHHSLSEAVRLYSQYVNFSKTNRLHINVQSFGEVDQLKHEFKLSVYRIIQELIQNVVKHANATELIVQIVVLEALLNITVEDNGVGFNEQPNDGLGLLNLKNRIKNMGGELVISSNLGVGTSIFIEFDISIYGGD